jgi:hypothetical protein
MYPDDQGEIVHRFCGLFFLPQRLGHEMRKIVPFYGGTMTQDISPQIFVVQFSNKTIMQEIMCRTAQ